MFTETEAKTKWCPLARAGDTRDEGRISINRSGNAADMDCLCLASACMAWQWSNRKAGHDPEFDGVKAAEDFTKRNPLRGFCGAFTHPSS